MTDMRYDRIHVRYGWVCGIIFGIFVLCIFAYATYAYRHARRLRMVNRKAAKVRHTKGTYFMHKMRMCYRMIFNVSTNWYFSHVGTGNYALNCSLEFYVLRSLICCICNSFFLWNSTVVENVRGQRQLKYNPIHRIHRRFLFRFSLWFTM